jgi:hypothetical protein
MASLCVCSTCIRRTNIVDVWDAVSPSQSSQVYSGRLRDVCVRFSVFENATLSTAVGTLRAEDDEGDAVTITVVGGDPDRAFSLQLVPAGTGLLDAQLVVNRVLDFETQSSYFLTLRVVDNSVGAQPAFYAMRVFVLDVNEPPLCPGESFGRSVREASPPGTAIPPPLQCIDPEGLPLTFTITVSAHMRANSVCACLCARSALLLCPATV